MWAIPINSLRNQLFRQLLLKDNAQKQLLTPFQLTVSEIILSWQFQLIDCRRSQLYGQLQLIK